MKRSTEKLQEALNLIALGVTRPTKIAKAMGVGYSIYTKWMVRSNRGDPEFIVTFVDEEMQWARAITLATKLALFELRGMVLEQSIFGYDEIMTEKGQVVWALCPEACAISDPEIREMLGYRADGLLEVDGKLVPLTVRRKAPLAQQLRLLESAFPDLRPSQTVNQNVAISGAVGVGFAKPVDYKGAPPQVPPPPVRPRELAAPAGLGSAPIDDADFAEIDDFGDEILPEPPLARIAVTIALPEPVPVAPQGLRIEPPRAGDTPPPQSPQGSGGPMTALQKDLWDRVQAAKVKGAITS
jgi:hypothetical protein